MTNPWSISYNALANIKHILWIIIQTCNSVDPGGIITSCSRNTIENTPKTRIFNYKNKNQRIFQARIEANYSMAIKVYSTKKSFRVSLYSSEKNAKLFKKSIQLCNERSRSTLKCFFSLILRDFKTFENFSPTKLYLVPTAREMMSLESCPINYDTHYNERIQYFNLTK